MSQKRNTLLRQARLTRMLTIEEVAKKLMVDPRTVMRWEQGVQNPRLPALRNLCDVFQMRPEDLEFKSLMEVSQDSAV